MSKNDKRFDDRRAHALAHCPPFAKEYADRLEIDLTVAGRNLPTGLLDTLKGWPSRSGFSINNVIRFQDGPILKTKILTIAAASRFLFPLVSTVGTSDVYVIAADEIYIENPSDIARVSVISFENQLPTLDGREGATGPHGSTPGGDTGASGAAGGIGVTGGRGSTLTVPALYVFFNKLIVSSGNPYAGRVLSFEINGFVGGNGGRGGIGGNGGGGARGTPGSRECSIFGCWCTSGPGRGGNGGSSGAGGRGGDAGSGANGGDITFCGPQSHWATVGRFVLSQEPGAPGTPGLPGSPGSPGQEGGGGSKPTECINGGGNGTHGVLPVPADLGAGAPALIGVRGLRYDIYRDNTDLGFGR